MYLPHFPVEIGISVGCMRAWCWGTDIFPADPKGAATRNQILGTCKLKCISVGVKCTAEHPKRPHRQGDGPVRSIPSASAGVRRGARSLLPSGSFSTASRFTAQLWSSRAVLPVVTLQPLSRLLSSLIFQELIFTSRKVSAGLGKPAPTAREKPSRGKTSIHFLIVTGVQNNDA